MKTLDEHEVQVIAALTHEFPNGFVEADVAFKLQITCEDAEQLLRRAVRSNMLSHESSEDLTSWVYKKNGSYDGRDAEMEPNILTLLIVVALTGFVLGCLIMGWLFYE